MPLADVDRILVVRREWLQRIFHGGKVWEMRTAPTRVRGKIALAEAGSGLIMGTARLVDSLPPLPPGAALQHVDKHQVTDPTLLQTWCYPWVLKDAQTLLEPVPYTHPPGAVIWVRLTEERLKI